MTLTPVRAWVAITVLLAAAWLEPKSWGLQGWSALALLPVMFAWFVWVAGRASR